MWLHNRVIIQREWVQIQSDLSVFQGVPGPTGPFLHLPSGSGIWNYTGRLGRASPARHSRAMRAGEGWIYFMVSLLQDNK